MQSSYTVNVAQAAAEMGTGVDAVLELIEAGTLPAAKLGKGYVIRKTDVVKHIDLVIAKQTSLRIDKHKAKNPIKPVMQEQEPVASKRGRQRKPIPALP